MSPRRDLADLETAAIGVADQADVEIRALHGYRETGMAAEVFAQVWGRSATHVPTELGVAFIESGNYVTGAFAEGTMVGATIGFLGWHDGTIHLHSHITGVVAEGRGRHVGSALKLDQAVWAARRNIDRISWSFDPFVRRNANFNFNTLGARAITYRENLYGPLEDRFSAREETDRILVDWYPTGPQATAARSGSLPLPNAEALIAKGAVAVLRDHDGPVVTPGRGDMLCVQIPDDIVAHRNETPHIAGAWRDALRATLEAGMNQGYVITGFDPTGWYILERRST
ncbi:MAG: GNAT family N-acetyltransferase [Gammaproteobacteria bacterium]|nr:GNAT family N-acetyltransferase [Gammaproteobacteria bacterium]